MRAKLAYQERVVAEKEKKARLKQKSKESKIIVIDPGHGGEDSGAVGTRKNYEKDVVLSLAKKLQSLINKKKGFKAFSPLPSPTNTTAPLARSMTIVMYL